MIEEFPHKLYGARFRSSFTHNVNKTAYKIDEYVCINAFDDYAHYHLSTDVKHTYKISKDLKVLETFYNLEEELENKALVKMDDLYNSQDDYKFMYGEEDSVESFSDQVYEDMFGIIMYPDKIFLEKGNAILWIRWMLEKEFTRLNESNTKTISMYTDDNNKASASFEKIVSDSVTIENPKIGTKFYKYINATGVFTYELTEIIEVCGIKLYKLLCNSCNHSAPCEVIVSHLMKDSYSLVKLCDDKNQHNFYHISETFFHTNKKTAYQNYLDKIKDYNNTVLNNLNKTKDIYELIINLSEI